MSADFWRSQPSLCLEVDCLSRNLGRAVFFNQSQARESSHLDGKHCETGDWREASLVKTLELRLWRTEVGIFSKALEFKTSDRKKKSMYILT